MRVQFVIHGEPASKANSREIGTIGGRKAHVLCGDESKGPFELKRMDVMVQDDDGSVRRSSIVALVGAGPDDDLRFDVMKVGGRIMNRKSDKALDYEHNALRQVPKQARLRMEGQVRVTIRIFYATERPDLDESILLDVLQDRYRMLGATRLLVQDGVYRNDRQVREKHVYHAIDKANPRAEIEIETIDAQQPELPFAVPDRTASKAMADKPF